MLLANLFNIRPVLKTVQLNDRTSHRSEIYRATYSVVASNTKFRWNSSTKFRDWRL